MKKERMEAFIGSRKAELKKVTAIALSAALLTGLAGCGGQSSKAESTDSITIGTMNLVNGDLIAQYEEYYEKELGVDVNIVKFDSGKDVNTAIAAGSVDISELGSAPTALGLSSGTDFEVIWAGDIIGSAESLVVTEDSGIESVADLAGKKIATPFASTAHYSLLNAIKAEGLSETDVELLDLQPDDIYAAWKRGDIDGAYVWYPVLDELLSDGGKVVTHSGELAEQGIITADLTVVRSAYAEANPDVVTKFIQAQIKANDVILNDADKAAEEVASVLEIEKEDAAVQLTQYEYLTGEEQISFLNDSLPAALKDTADFLVEQDSIKSALSLDEFKEKITSEYVEAALKEE